MDFREEKPSVGRLEYVLISVLAVVVAWAAWIMLEPVVWPVLDQFVQTAFEEVAATSTPTPSAGPEGRAAGSVQSLAASLRSAQGLYLTIAPSAPPECPPKVG